MNTAIKAVLGVVVVSLALPDLALACEQCLGVGGANGPTIRALVLSMASLLTVVTGVGVGIGMFFVNMHRRSRALEPGDFEVTRLGNIRPRSAS